MLSIDHVVFPVWDVRASLEFYGRTLGLPLIGAIDGDDWGGKRWLMLMFGLSDARELVLVALRGARRPADDLPADTRHYAFGVDSREQQAAWRDRLSAAAVDHWEEDHGDQHSLYFADPNGVILEITTPPTRAGDVDDSDAWNRARAWIESNAAVTA